MVYSELLVLHRIRIPSSLFENNNFYSTLSKTKTFSMLGTGLGTLWKSQKLIPSKKNQSVLIAEGISLKPQKIASPLANEAPSAMLSRSCFILKAPKKYHEVDPPEFFFFFFYFKKNEIYKGILIYVCLTSIRNVTSLSSWTDWINENIMVMSNFR